MFEFFLSNKLINAALVTILAFFNLNTSILPQNIVSPDQQLTQIESSNSAEPTQPTLSPTPSILKTTPSPKPITPTAAPQLPSAPAGSGYSRSLVTTGAGSFTVDLIAADLSSTKVIVDTASSSDCRDNCPVLSLGDFVGRNGAYAGINGSFFCPSTYPNCAGKTNSFDTLVMNKNKTYFNSDNNVYSTVPAVIFSPGSIRFISQTLEWGRDTGIDSMIANYPLYLLGGNNVFGGSSDSKLTAKGARTFVGGGNGKVYIGVIQNAASSDVPDILKKIGVQDALGMDQGGSTALWANGRYIMGPGRGIPTAILFLKR